MPQGLKPLLWSGGGRPKAEALGLPRGEGQMARARAKQGNARANGKGNARANAKGNGKGRDGKGAGARGGRREGRIKGKGGANSKSNSRSPSGMTNKKANKQKGECTKRRTHKEANAQRGECTKRRTHKGRNAKGTDVQRDDTPEDTREMDRCARLVLRPAESHCREGGRKRQGTLGGGRDAWWGRGPGWVRRWFWGGYGVVLGGGEAVYWRA